MSQSDLLPPPSHPSGGPDRRRFLRLGGAAFGAAAVGVAAACTQDRADASGGTTSTPTRQDKAPSTLPAGPAPSGAPATFSLIDDESMNFEALFALGAAGTSSATGEVITAVDRINGAAGGASVQGFYDAFVAEGNRLLDRAADADSKGRSVTARDRYLRAAQYYDQALFYVLGTSTPDAEQDVYETMDSAWSRAAELSGFERMEIPYEDTKLPAWFIPAREPDGSLASGRRPLVIVNNGSDAQLVDTYGYGGAAAAARGMHALLFEGPGQGAPLFVDKIPFRPDWEAVIGPVFDAVASRRDVDSERIALTGWSEGGYLVARAAAFVDGLAAVVSDPGVVDVWLAFPEMLRSTAEGDRDQVNSVWREAIIPGATPEQRYELAKRLEIYSTEALEQARRGEVPTDWYGLSRRIQEFNDRDVAERISVPMLVTNYAEEQFYPGQATELAGLVGDRAEVVDFTVAEGAQYHCAPMNPQWRNEVVLDWLAERLEP